jgi:hypothetical protein
MCLAQEGKQSKRPNRADSVRAARWQLQELIQVASGRPGGADLGPKKSEPWGHFPNDLHARFESRPTASSQLIFHNTDL